MPTLHLSVFPSLAFAASLVLGASSSRADYAHDQAQQSVANSQADLNIAKARADQAQATLGSAGAQAVDLSRRFDSARQEAGAIRQRMERGQAALPEIHARIETASNTLDARHREMAVADLQYGPLKFADEQARLDAIKSFEESAEYRSALQAVSDIAAARQTTQAESVRRGHHPESDPNVLIAQNRLSAAKAALDSLRAQFMQEQLPQIPKVSLADQALGAEQVRYDAISAKAQVAEKELADARATLERQNKGLAGDQATLDQVTADITHMQADQATAQAAADRAAEDTSRADAYVDAARQSRDNAVAALQQIDAPPPVIVPSTTYEYAPPPVVYGQPPTGYVPGPYYGNIVVVPRGGGHQWGGDRGSQHPAYSHEGHGHGGGHR